MIIVDDVAIERHSVREYYLVYFVVDIVDEIFFVGRVDVGSCN